MSAAGDIQIDLSHAKLSDLDMFHASEVEIYAESIKICNVVLTLNDDLIAAIGDEYLLRNHIDQCRWPWKVEDPATLPLFTNWAYQAMAEKLERDGGYLKPDSYTGDMPAAKTCIEDFMKPAWSSIVDGILGAYKHDPGALYDADELTNIVFAIDDMPGRLAGHARDQVAGIAKRLYRDKTLGISNGKYGLRRKRTRSKMIVDN